MPNKNTFDIKPINELIHKYYNPNEVWLNPFANTNTYGITNDLDPQYNTDYNLDALEFLKLFADKVKNNEVIVSGILYDPPYCYDGDTDVFTDSGWKHFDDLTYDDYLATLNTETNMLEYQKPLEIIKSRYKGEMISIDSQSINLLVTPNHKMWVKDSLYGKCNFSDAKDLLGRNVVWFQKNCDYDGGIEQDYFYLPEVKLLKANRYGEKVKPIKKIKMDTWLKFFGCFLADGATHNTSKSKYKYVVSITKKKSKDRAVIKSILDELGYNYYIQKDGFRIQDKQLWTYLKQFGKAHEKFIPYELKQLSIRQLKILFKHMMMCDGTQKRYAKYNKEAKKWYSYDNCEYYTVSHRLMNDFCEIAIKLGFSISTGIKKKEKHRDCYRIRLLKSDYFRVYNKNIKKINNFDGYVYCVVVPNKTLLVRRNNRICWCGNSPRQISECYTKLGKTVNMQTTQASYWSNQKKQIGRIVKKGGITITCGWNSGGIGKKYGFKIIEILLVPHGGWHNDTIVTVERKIK